MRRLPLVSAALLAVTACSGSGRVIPVNDTPPSTKVIPVTDELHGVAVTDNYRWLEGDTSDPENAGKVTPEVAAWTDTQNAYTRSVLDHLPGRAAIEASIKPLMEIGSVTAPRARQNRYFFSRRERSENQPLFYWREGVKGDSKVLVDPAKLDASGLTTIEWVSPAPDGRTAAYGTYRAGDENTTLHIVDVDTDATEALEIPNKTQAPDWMPDGSGFVYQNLKNPKDPYSGQVLFHRKGTPVSRDALLFRQYTKAENEKLATTWGPFGTLSRDGHWLVLGYWTDTKSNDLWLANFDRFLKTGHLDKTVVSVGADGSASGTVIEGTLYVETTKGAPKGRVVAVDPAHPDQGNWRAIVPERSDSVIEDVSFGKGHFAVTYLKNASNVIEVFDYSGKSWGAIRLPGIGSATIVTEEDRTDGFVTFTSFNYPTTVFHVDMATPDREPELWERPEVPVDPSTVDVEQVWYPSKDGTRISMFLVHKKGLQPTGKVPVLLTGYGGFDISETPVFSATLFPWFNAGGLYALPNLRGGGEYGDAWHEAGMLDHKQNVFDDFIAAAEWLIGNHYTTPARLAIVGGSNGGLLTGAAITQRPDLFRAALVLVPLLDMLRYQQFLMARYWVPEYGSSEDAHQFEVLRQYSPYQHVTAGTKYPAVLLTAGENDSRVHALHARKMAALLQASTASNPHEQPVLLWVDRDAGHGQGKPLNLRVRDAVDQRIFVMWQLGMLQP